MLAVVDVEEVHDPDPATEAKLVFETDDPAHPGVAATLARRGPLVGGAVQVLRLPATPAELGPRLTPAQVRADAVARGWRTMVGFQTRNPVHRAHEYLQKVALEHVDGLLLHPLVGETKDDDIPADVRMRCYRVLLDNYYPAERVLLSVLPAAMRYAGPARGDLPRAGAQELRLHPLHRRPRPRGGRQLLRHLRRPPHLPRVRRRASWASSRCSSSTPSSAARAGPWRPAGPARTRPRARVHLSGTAVRELLGRGELPPPEFSRPEVAQLLADGYRARRD